MSTSIETEIPPDLAFQLPAGDSSTEANYHKFESQESSHRSNAAVRILVPQISYLSQGSFFTVEVRNAAGGTNHADLDSTFSCFDKMTIKMNGKEIFSEEFYGVVENNLFMDQPGDAREQGWKDSYGVAIGSNMTIDAGDTRKFLMPIRLGHILNPYRNKIPLKHLAEGLRIELTVAATGKAFRATQDAPNNNPILEIGTVTFHAAISDVAPEVDRAIGERMREADLDSSKMLPLMFQEITISSQGSPAAAGQQVLTFNPIASRTTWLKVLQIDNDYSVSTERFGSSLTSFRNEVTSARFSINGVSFPASGDIRILHGDAGDPELYAYYLSVLRNTQKLYAGGRSMFEPDVNVSPTSKYSKFFRNTRDDAYHSLNSENLGVFQICLDLDTTSDLIAGLSLSNQVQLTINKADPGTPSTMLLLANHEKLVWISQSKANPVR